MFNLVSCPLVAMTSGETHETPDDASESAEGCWRSRSLGILLFTIVNLSAMVVV